MKARSFHMFTFDLMNIEMADAWKEPARIVFSMADVQHFGLIRKRNCGLYDALTDIRHLPYTVSDNVLNIFLFDVISADLSVDAQMPYVRCGEQMCQMEDLRLALLASGFSICKDDGEEIRFVPFVASASMSRKSEYLFVNQVWADALMQKGTLGIVTLPEGVPGMDRTLLDREAAFRQQAAEGQTTGASDPWAFVSVTKLAAYAGLFMSDGSSVRECRANQLAQTAADLLIPDSRLGLNAENTICLDDADISLNYENFDFMWEMTSTGATDAAKKQLSTRLRSGHTINGALSDGCGFLDGDTFARLENGLYGDGKRSLNAWQIRLPWMKGLMIRFSFADYIRERMKDNHVDLNEVYLRDIFNIPRKLFDRDGRCLIKAVFTKSMFKGNKYFCKLTDGDPWALYWARLEEHGASVIVAGKNSEPATKTRLNYQFLSSLGLDRKKIGQMLSDQMARYRLFYDDNTSDETRLTLFRDLFADATAKEGDAIHDDEQAAPDEENAADGSGNAQDPAAQDPTPQDANDAAEDADPAIVNSVEFMQTQYYWDQAKSLIQSAVVDMSRGKFVVEGDVRYLVPDLLEMMEYYVHALLCKADGTPAATIDDLPTPHFENGKIKAPGRYLMINYHNGTYHRNAFGYYYAPQLGMSAFEVLPAPEKMAAAGIEQDRPALILRNPHYAPGEIVTLSRIPEESVAFYRKWTGHLNGVVLVPSGAMCCINGADVDGDRVQCITDPELVAAAQKLAQDNAAALRLLLSCFGPEPCGDLRLSDMSKAEQSVRELFQQIAKAQSDRMAATEKPGRNASVICTAPLYYGGSESAKLPLSPAYLSGKDAQGVSNLARQMAACFLEATQQEIGLISLSVLDVAVMSYDNWRRLSSRGTVPDEATMLDAFRSHYTLVHTALKGAIEIDKAKTGLTFEDGPLARNISMTVKRNAHCKFRNWNSTYKKKQNALTRRKFGRDFFAATLKDMVDSWKGQKECSADHPLETLPATVYAAFSSLNDDCLQRPEGEALPVEQANAGALPYRLRPLRSLAAIFEDRSETPLWQDKACLRDLQALLERYRECCAVRRCGEMSQQNMQKRHENIVRQMLFDGDSLREAHKEIKHVQSLLSSWHALGRDAYQAGANAVSKALSENMFLVRWGWGDEQARSALLREILTGPDGKPDAPLLPLPEPGSDEERVFTRRALGCVLFKEVIRYAQAEAGSLIPRNHMGPTISAVPEKLKGKQDRDEAVRKLLADTVYTPQALKNRMCKLLELYGHTPAPERTDGDFLTACIWLNRKNKLKDFLLVAMVDRRMIEACARQRGGVAP